MIYNDAYSALLGDRHPGALGRPRARSGRKSMVNSACSMQLDPARRARRFLRRGSPVADPPIRHAGRGAVYHQLQPDPRCVAQSGIGGVLVTVFETTERVRNEKRAARTHRRLEAEVRAAHPRTRSHLEGVGGPARRFQLRGLFHQRQPGVDQPCSAGPRTKSSRCTSTSCVIPTTRPPPSPAARGWRRACRPCAWKTVSVTATAPGAGSPGP